MIVTKQKVRHWIYVGIFLALLGYGLYFLLLHSSGLDRSALETIYSEQKESYDAVSSYLSEKNYSTEITSLLTVDHHFGIKSEDTAPYRAFVTGIERLYEKNLDRIVCKDGNVTFYLQAEGGLLNRQYAVLVYQKDSKKESALVDGVTADKMTEPHWYGTVCDKQSA